MAVLQSVSGVAPSLVRVVVCGSVDDGKSTLIGRLLWDSEVVAEDQAAKLEADSARYGRTEHGLDYALLLDGLQAEREQAITIDVAYRYLAVGNCRLILADVPGHEQYTRNMATGASLADDERAAATQDWLDQIERVHLLLRLSGRLRQKHGD